MRRYARGRQATIVVITAGMVLGLAGPAAAAGRERPERMPGERVMTTEQVRAAVGQMDRTERDVIGKRLLDPGSLPVAYRNGWFDVETAPDGTLRVVSVPEPTRDQTEAHLSRLAAAGSVSPDIADVYDPSYPDLYACCPRTARTARRTSGRSRSTSTRPRAATA